MVNTAAESPQSSRLFPEIIKPTSPATKQIVPAAIEGLIFAVVNRRPTAYCRLTTIAALTGSTTATTFSAKLPFATTMTYWEIHEANAPLTNDARKADRVNQSRALSRNSTDGDQTDAVVPSTGVSARFTQVWINTSGKAEQMAASQNGRLMLCMTSRVPSGGPTVQPILSTV